MLKMAGADGTGVQGMMRSLRICFVGDSFVNGTGDETALGWVGRVCAWARTAGYDVTGYNLGIRGETSCQVAARWRREAEPRLSAPDIVPRLLFSFGVNDCCPASGWIDRAVVGDCRVPLEASVGAATMCLQSAGDLAPVLLVGPPPIGDVLINHRIAELDARLARVAMASSVGYLSVFSALAADAVWVRSMATGDGAHPGGEGYERLARLVWHWPAWQGWLSASGVKDGSGPLVVGDGS